MSFEFPSSLREAVAAWLTVNAPPNVREHTQRLRHSYAAGRNSTSVDIAAYLSTRMPATFASIAFAMDEVAKILNELAPSSMLDIGAGPGTASFAAHLAWPSLQQFTLVEQDRRFAAVAEVLGRDVLPRFAVMQQSLLDAKLTADLVTAAYVLAELPTAQAANTALHLWEQTRHTLILVEPGTPQGFARMKACRNALLAAGAHMIGPCPHESTCPMAGEDWCHFKTRLPRSRAHMQAKGASVPFEDEAFSWLAVSRFPAKLPPARIIGPASTNKVAVTMRVCDAQGAHDESFASRQKATYNAAKKLKWGEALPPCQNDDV